MNREKDAWGKRATLWHWRVMLGHHLTLKRSSRGNPLDRCVRVLLFWAFKRPDVLQDDISSQSKQMCKKTFFFAPDRMDWIFLQFEATNSYTVFLYMFSLSPQKYYSGFLVWFNSFPQKRQHLMSSPVPLMMTFETSLHQLKCWYMLRQLMTIKTGSGFFQGFLW